VFNQTVLCHRETVSVGSGVRNRIIAAAQVDYSGMPQFNEVINGHPSPRNIVIGNRVHVGDSDIVTGHDNRWHFRGDGREDVCGQTVCDENEPFHLELQERVYFC
jgi:hypothetical protein